MILPHKMKFSFIGSPLKTHVELVHGSIVSKMKVSQYCRQGKVNMRPLLSDPVLNKLWDLCICYKTRVHHPYLLFLHYYYSQTHITRQILANNKFPFVLIRLIINYLELQHLSDASVTVP